MTDAVGVRVGLRVDVDTFRGTRLGVPRLVDIFARRDIAATFFFTVGPDNMGRHLWRLLRPQFLVKMLRSRAASLYGWDILLRGTLWPGPRIGEALPGVIRACADAGHEIGFHAWDHHRWQMRLESMSPREIHEEIRRGVDCLEAILGFRPDCSATAGWRCDERVLLEKHGFGFRYNSDCRGDSLFRPVAGGVECEPQVPVTLPTYDELIGRDGISDDNYNETLLSRLAADSLNVYTVHAEVEGISKADLFERFLDEALQRGVRFLPLRELLGEPDAIPTGRVHAGTVAGREGWVCRQVAVSP